MKIKNDILYELERQYTSALQDYLEGGGETELECAYEIGRRAIAENCGILDMAAVHQGALVRVLPCMLTSQKSTETIKKAGQFFAESIAPFEMTFRGFQESIMKLYDLNKTLQQSEMKFRSVVETANDAIISSDSNGSIISWNKYAQTIFGYTEEEVLGRPLTVLMPERYKDIISRELEESNNESKYYGKTLESRGLRKDGIEFLIEISTATWKTEEGTFFTAIIRDTTERRRAEEQILEQAALLDKAQDAIGVRDLEHRIIYLNKSAQHLYGWTAEEIIGKNADELLYKEKSPQLIEARESVIEKGEWMGELRQRTKDCKELIVESRWTLVRDNEGKPKSILIINTDITEKKALEEQLLRAQRLESIGTLAGGMAHDLNNLLTPIMMSVQMLKEKFTDEQSHKLLTILEQNSMRGANLIKQVLSFARGMEGERTPLQVAYLISEIERIIKETFPRNIEIQTCIQKDLFTISGDSTQMHQVIMNLCVNARDAMPDGGTLRITASNFFIDENYARMHLEAKVGSYALVAISDTGTGIPAGILDRIFEPFFTTKEHGKGTGLGLSTAQAIVKSHSGFINVYSEVGKGTTFKVYLPAIKTEMQKAEEQVEPPIGHGELILVVEDETSVLEITRVTLETHGYRALAASDGAEATAVYAKNAEEVKVVLMDMMMPVMDGPSSIRALRKINHKVKIIAMSGLTENGRLTKITGGDVHAFLPKPYTAEKLLKTVHEVLFDKNSTSLA